VSEYQALPELDANGHAIAFEHIVLQNEGWVRDTDVPEPTQDLKCLISCLDRASAFALCGRGTVLGAVRERPAPTCSRSTVVDTRAGTRPARPASSMHRRCHRACGERS